MNSIIPLFLVPLGSFCYWFVQVNKSCLLFLMCVWHIFPVVTFKYNTIIRFLFIGWWLIGWVLCFAIQQCFILVRSILPVFSCLLGFVLCWERPSLLRFCHFCLFNSPVLELMWFLKNPCIHTHLKFLSIWTYFRYKEWAKYPS